MKCDLFKKKRLVLITAAIMAVAVTVGFVATLLADKPAKFNH